MKTSIRMCIAWALLLISSFSAFSASAFSGSSNSDSDRFSALLQERANGIHAPGFHTTPSEFRISNTLLEAFDVEEETESDTDESDNDDQSDLLYAALPSIQSYMAATAAIPNKEDFPAGFSTAFPTTRSLYLIFGVFRI